MRGINRVILSGNVTGKISFSTTDKGSEACTFVLAIDRPSKTGVITAFVKVNVYLESLVRLCQGKLVRGCYLLVEGELMNRDSPVGRSTEVRAWELVFLSPAAASQGAPRDPDDRPS